VIVGFPTETEPDFLDSLSLLDEVEFDTLYSFTYSQRPGTAAEELNDPIPEGEKLERLARLQAKQAEIQRRRNAAWVGSEVEVLVEGPRSGTPGTGPGAPRAPGGQFRGESARAGSRTSESPDPPPTPSGASSPLAALDRLGDRHIYSLPR